MLDGERSHQAVDRERLSASEALLEIRIGLYHAIAGGLTMKAPAKVS